MRSRSRKTELTGSKRLEGVFPSGDLGTDNFSHEHSINIVSYRHVVEQHSQRQLTRPGDVLDAFAGVGEQLETVFRSRLLYGLPQTELIYTLLWRPDAAFTRRSDSDTGQPVLPSWSWAGWTGKVRYRPNIHTLPCVKFILEDDRIVTSDDLRAPSLGVPSQSSHPWWRETWTENTTDGQPAYYYEHAGNENAWFAHSTAPMETRLSMPGRSHHHHPRPPHFNPSLRGRDRRATVQQFPASDRCFSVQLVLVDSISCQRTARPYRRLHRDTRLVPTNTRPETCLSSPNSQNAAPRRNADASTTQSTQYRPSNTGPSSL